MSQINSSFLSLCQERGYINQCTNINALDARLNSNAPVSAYIGFDCTADSLHIGSLLQIMILRHFQQCGHKPIILMGGGTTKVGDPSGKDKSRQMLNDATIAANMAGITKVFEQFIAFGDGPTDAIIVNNDDWLCELHYIDFLRDIGKHFSINQMLTMDSVKQRLERESHLSFLEFNYMILQAYDFVELSQRYNCQLQIGGSDQWGNIVNGTELHRRLHAANTPDAEYHAVFGLTTPLVTNSAGAKMGKTADGAIWLDKDLLSAYDYWQFWRNVDDADVSTFLRFFTELPIDEISRLDALEGAAINEAKKILATQVTTMLHGSHAAAQAEITAQATFEQGTIDENLPKVMLSAQDTAEPLPAFKLFQLSGLAASGAEARRLIKGGGARINDEKVSDENQMIDIRALCKTAPAKLSSGKKKHILLLIG